MFLYLAQVAPPPEALKQWLETLFWLSGGILALVMLWRQLTDKSDRQILELHGRIKRERAELDEEIRQLGIADKELRTKLDAEIKDLRDEVVDVPRQVVALLRETKGLL